MKKTILTIVLLANSLLFYGQNSINSSGKDITSSTGSISYSVGQLFLENSSTSNGSIFSGVQFPFVNATTLGLNDNTTINLGIDAYPNPVVDKLTLTFNNVDIKDLTYVVYNTLGLKLMKGKVSDLKTNLNFEHLPNTMYLITILKNNKTIKNFKVFKK